MRNILLVMKNNLYRFTKEKVMMTMVVGVMPIIICLGVYFNGMDSIKGKIAVVGARIEEKEMIEGSMMDNEKVKVEFLEESPSKTELIKGVYLAEINFQGNEPSVISYGKDDIKKSLEANLKGEVYVGDDNNATVQGKIIGFLIMFLFFGATTMVMDFFLVDRENGTYTRVLSGKISYFQYITGQMLYSTVILTIPSTMWSVFILKVLNVNLEISYSLFTFLLLLVGVLSSSFGMFISTIFKPSTMWSVFILKVLNVNLEISYSLFTFLLLLVGVLSSSFGMFISTIFKDRASASMGGSIVVMITCLLGGCLINIADSNKVIGFIRNILPQKRLIDLSNNFNNTDLIFVIFSILVFGLISVILGERQYKNGDFLV